MSSKIEWTQETWNPLAGCTPVSAGCRNCYAANHARRLAGNPNPKVSGAYERTARTAGDGRAVFTGKVNLLPERLEQPLRWKKPRRVFVNSMSDLFHEDVPTGFIAHVFAVMAAAYQHTFQILTKRPERMAEVLNDEGFWAGVWGHGVERWWDLKALALIDDIGPEDPLPNVWLGTSVEDQAAADERIPHLLRSPAAVRFLSCEPLLGPVDIVRSDSLALAQAARDGLTIGQVDWVIIGGESGPGARPCDVEWIRSLLRQCQSAGVPAFVKQLGANIRDRNDAGFDSDWHDGEGWPEPREVEHDPRGFREEYQGAPVRVHLEDRKGGDPQEWPEDLRVRQFPQTNEVPA